MVATEELAAALNAAVTLERPLLVKASEPGTGKTELARQIANAMNAPLLEWHIKSTTQGPARGFYEYDAGWRACATASSER